MNRVAHPLVSTLRRIWAVDRPLTAMSVLMCGTLAATLIGLVVDPRTILGAPAWLKPAKFAASIAIFGFTMAWIFGYLQEWPRLRRRVSTIVVAVFLGEMAIIVVQAWRGTTSHFNVGTPLDAALFSAMGFGILLQTAATIAVAVALWRQAFADRALAWALRLGIVISLVGSGTGGLMTAPTGTQLAEARTAGTLSVAGAHTVGAPDGGPGMPGTGWSVAHGDLRVPHFVGLHAIQVLPLLLLAMPSRWSATVRARVTLASAGSYAALFVLLLAQALGGESVVQPSALTLTLFTMWALSSAVVLTAAATVNSRPGRTQALSF